MLWALLTFFCKGRDQQELREWGYWLVIPGAVTAGLWTLLDLWRVAAVKDPVEPLPQAELFLWSGFWILLPPIFFFLEFHVLFGTCEGDDKLFDRIKHQQHLAAAVWLAFVSVIGGASVRDWVKELREEGQKSTLEQRVTALEAKAYVTAPRKTK